MESRREDAKTGRASGSSTGREDRSRCYHRHPFPGSKPWESPASRRSIRSIPTFSSATRTRCATSAPTSPTACSSSRACSTDKLDFEGSDFYVTSIASGHGQAFDGFLHMSDTRHVQGPRRMELFRAHEVGARMVRPQGGLSSGIAIEWLSEALAEYAGMMFVEGTVGRRRPRFLRRDPPLLRRHREGKPLRRLLEVRPAYLIEFNAAHRSRV